MSVWCFRELVVAPVYYGLCSSEQIFHKELRKMKMARSTWPPFISNDWSNGTAHFFEREGKVCVIVCVRATASNTGIEIAGLLVHEAVHIWQEIRERLGEKAPSSEFEAYSIQKIAQELMIEYKEQSVAPQQ